MSRSSRRSCRLPGRFALGLEARRGLVNRGVAKSQVNSLCGVRVSGKYRDRWIRVEA
jgi:hypothetical protein